MSDDAFKRWYFHGPGAEAFRLAGSYLEPVDGVDAAEKSLRSLGKRGESYVELRLNGDPEPHTVVFYLEDGNFGIWNTEFAKWPVFYAEHEGEMYDGNPFIEDEDSERLLEGKSKDAEEDDEDGFGEEDEDSEIMNLGGGDDDEEDDDSEQEEEDGEDEEDDSGDEVPPMDELEDRGDDDEPQSGDDDYGDEGEDEKDQRELKEEDEMPRVKLFSKFRGPLGWRKRAESEELEEFNVFEMVVGMLDDQAEKPKDQERDQLVRANFVENVRGKSTGLFCVELPQGIQMVQDPEVPTLWFATIPYNPDERN